MKTEIFIDITFDDVLRNNFSDKFNKILGSLSILDLLSNRILIVVHMYHASYLEYLVYDKLDYSQISYK